MSRRINSPIAGAHTGQEYAYPVIRYSVIAKRCREPESRDIRGGDLDSEREIHGGRVVADDAPTCREVHLGPVRTNDLDAPPPFFADDAVNLEAPHIVLVCEQKSDLCTRAVGASGGPDPLALQTVRLTDGVRETCFNYRAISGQEPPVENRLLARKDLITRCIDANRVRDAVGTRVSVLIAVDGSTGSCPGYSVPSAEPHSPLLRLGGIEVVDRMFRKLDRGQRGGEP